MPGSAATSALAWPVAVSAGLSRGLGGVLAEIARHRVFTCRVGPGAGGAAAAMAAKHVGARFFVPAKLQQAALLGFFQQVAKGPKTVIGFAEVGFAAFDGFLEHRSPDLAAVAALGDQCIKGLYCQLNALGAARLLCFLAVALFLGRAPCLGCRIGRLAPGLRALAFTHQIVVENELVAIGNQQVRGGLLDAHTDHLLGVFAQLGDERGEVGIAADDHKGVDVRLGVAQVQCVHHKADVGRVFARLSDMGNLDQLEVGFMHRGLEALVAIPVAIGLFDDDGALEQQAFEHRLDVELVVFGVTHSKGDVFKVAEQCHADAVGGGGHVVSIHVAGGIITRKRGGMETHCRFQGWLAGGLVAALGLSGDVRATGGRGHTHGSLLLQRISTCPTPRPSPQRHLHRPAVGSAPGGVPWRFFCW